MDSTGLRRRTARDWVLPVALGTSSLVLALGIEMQPGGSGRLAAIYPPWWGGGRAIAAAAGAGEGVVIGVGALPFVVIAAPGAQGANLLRRSGAWLVVGGDGAGLCGGGRLAGGTGI